MKVLQSLALTPAACLVFVALATGQTVSTLTTVVNPANGHTYHLLDNSDWTTAHATALSLGGNLATIEDLAENTFLTSNFSNYANVTRHLWIGFSDGAVEGTWTWTSGSTSTFTNWWVAGGAPNNSTANDPINGEDFACIYPTGEWEDLHDHASSQWFPVLCGVVEVESLGTAYCFGDGTGAICPCGNAGGSDEGCTNSTGNGATLTADGTQSVGADDISFQLTNGPGSVPGIVFAGTLKMNGGSGVLFGDGLLCAGGSIQRLGVVFLDGAGSATWGPGLAPLGGWGAGDTRYFQGWYRDPSGPCGNQFNTSQGLEVAFEL